MTKRVVVTINSGSAIVVKNAVIRMLDIDPSLAALSYDEDGNVTAVEAVVPDSRMPVLQNYLRTIPGVDQVEFHDDPESEAVPSSIGNWVLSTDVSVQFTDGVDGLNGPAGINHYAGPKEGAVIRMVVTNGNGVTDILNGVSTVTLAAAGGAAPKINGSSQPITLRLVNGSAIATVSDSEPGEVRVSMTSITHPFAALVGDSAVVTLS